MTISKIPLLSSVHANPSGGFRPDKTARDMKTEGSTLGMLDITWPLPRGRYMGFYFELKAQYANGKSNKPSKPQSEWMRYFKECGYYAEWGVGWETMKQAILDYYALGPSEFRNNDITPLDVNQFRKPEFKSRK